MSKFYEDIFYDVTYLSIEEKIDILEYAKSKCKKWIVNILDISHSLIPYKVIIEWKDVISKLDDNSFFRIIHRKGYPVWRESNTLNAWQLEISFYTANKPEYHIYVYLDEEYVDYFVNKYNLKKLSEMENDESR